MAQNLDWLHKLDERLTHDNEMWDWASHEQRKALWVYLEEQKDKGDDGTEDGACFNLMVKFAKNSFLRHLSDRHDNEFVALFDLE